MKICLFVLPGWLEDYWPKAQRVVYVCGLHRGDLEGNLHGFVDEISDSGTWNLF